MASLNQLLEAQKRFQEQLMKKSGVVGVAVGYRNYKGESTDQLALVALVERKMPVESISREDLVPRDIDGAATDVYEVGKIEALQSLNPRSRIRPNMPGGISMGHYKITAGTHGVVVYDRTTNEKLLLSNNHVFANSNEAMIGDDILQPGPVDGGSRPTDTVAWLERFVKMQFVGDEPPPSTDPDPDPTPDPTPDPDPDPTPDPLPPGTGENPTPTPPDNGNEPTPTPQPPTTPTNPPSSNCDIVSVIASLGNLIAALNGSEQRLTAASASSASSRTATTSAATATAQVTPNNRVDCAVARPVNPDAFPAEINGIGAITGTRLPALGMGVRKSGRTTGYTEGMITLLNATVNVGYNTSEGNKTARFTGQVIATAMSQGGDSGSLIVDQNSQSAVGLLFAGSSVATIFTPIGIVLDTLNIKLGPA